MVVELGVVLVFKSADKKHGVPLALVIDRDLVEIVARRAVERAAQLADRVPVADVARRCLAQAEARRLANVLEQLIPECNPTPAVVM